MFDRRSVAPPRLSLIIVMVLASCCYLTAGEPAPTAVGKPLSGGWLVRTGVLPAFEATASIDAKGVFSLAGGGSVGTWPRGTLVPADRARMNAAFVYQAFTSDFVLTARRIAFNHGTGHENSGSGLAAMGNLSGLDTPMACNAANNDGKPVWFRLIRRGDRVGLYEGPDGQQWMASNAGALIPGTVYAGLYTESWGENGASTAQFDSVTIELKPTFTYTSTWLGNEFEGGPKNTVNSSMIGLGVAPDGTCITAGVNGEQENCMGRYRDGQVLTGRPPHMVGDSGNALVLMANGEGLVARHSRIQRFDWDKQNGKIGKPSDPLGSKDVEEAIRGLAVFKDEVFASCRYDHTIIVLDLATLKIKRTMPFQRPGPLVVDAKGVLWIVEEGWVSGHPYSYPYPKPFRVLGLDRQSGKQLHEITSIELPSAIFADEHGATKARLLIADNGKDQQVKVFDVSGAQPKAIGTLGMKGGVYGGTPGEMKPGKFNGISGVGSDAKGTLYVSTSGYPYRVVIPAGMPNISQLKAFAPSAIDQAEPDAAWTLTCPGFNCMGAAWDAKTGDVYIGALARYRFDAKRGLGREWQIAGTTADLRTDRDGESLLRTFFAAPDIRWLDGERFLFLRERVYRLDKNGNLGKLVRILNLKADALRDQAQNVAKGAADSFSLEALFGRFPANPPTFTLDKNKNQSDWRFWEWVDGQGGPADGLQQREEYRDLSQKIPYGYDEGNVSASYDSKGDMWISGVSQREIHHRAYTGLKQGVPQWSDEVRSFSLPMPFKKVMWLSYQPERDSMVIAGQTDENQGGGTQIAEAIRYSTWSTTPTPGDRIVFMPPGVTATGLGEGSWQIPRLLDVVTGVSVVGDVLYATNRTGAVRAYDLNKGNLIEWMSPGPEVFGSGGFFDYFDTAVKAYESAKDEHLVVRQSNWTVRIIAHRWNPLACNDGHLPPAPEIRAQPRAGEVELLWGGRTGRSGTVTGYQVYRSDKKDGTFQKVGKAIQRPSFRDAQVDGKVFWYRVATINLAGEGPQSDPVCAAAATCTVKRVISQDKIGADGLDLTTRGNWQGVYGREAAYLAKDHGKKDAPASPRRHLSPAVGSLIWPGTSWGNPVGPSDDVDLLQSLAGPGLRCQTDNEWRESQWGPALFVVNVTDGKPRQLSIALGVRNARILFTDPDSNKVIHEETVVMAKGEPKVAYCTFTVTGRFRMELFGEPFKAVFIDPAVAAK